VHEERWPLQRAKNQLSAVIDAARTGEPQIVTRHGKPAAVVLKFEDYERLKVLETKALPSFSELLLAMPQDDNEFERLELEPRSIEF
jgi:prevent-host-death family protein